MTLRVFVPEADEGAADDGNAADRSNVLHRIAAVVSLAISLLAACGCLGILAENVCRLVCLMTAIWACVVAAYLLIEAKTITHRGDRS